MPKMRAWTPREPAPIDEDQRFTRSVFCCDVDAGTIRSRVTEHNKRHVEPDKVRMHNRGNYPRAELDRWGMYLSTKEWRRRPENFRYGTCSACKQFTRSVRPADGVCTRDCDEGFYPF